MAKFNKALLGGSIILLITFNLYNLINFIFQFAMARMLSAADYGVLATLFSFIYLSFIFSESMTTILAKYSAGENNKGKIKNLLKRSLKKSFKFSSLIFLAYAIIAIPLSSILSINYFLLASAGLMIYASFFLSITRGTLQGRKMFRSLGSNLVFESAVKLGLGIFFVIIGWRVYGAMAAIIVGYFFAFIISFIPLREIFKSKESQMHLPGFYNYSWPAFIMLFSVMIFFSLDIIIARIVFDGETAGYYAIASTLAKTIFTATNPITKAMFPLSAEGKEGKPKSLLINSLFMILPILFACLVILFFFPDYIIHIFTGRAIVESSNILVYPALAMSFLSLANLFLFFKLSRAQTKNYWVFPAFPIIQAVLLGVFSDNLIEFSLALIAASAIFLWGAIFLTEDE